MKIEIEITEETAACLWANNWRLDDRDVATIIKDIAEEEARAYSRSFPSAVAADVAAFREVNVIGEAVPACTPKIDQTASSASPPPPCSPS
jgi:hypothetical protein